MKSIAYRLPLHYLFSETSWRESHFFGAFSAFACSCALIAAISPRVRSLATAASPRLRSLSTAASPRACSLSIALASVASPHTLSLSTATSLRSRSLARSALATPAACFALPFSSSNFLSDSFNALSRFSIFFFSFAGVGDAGTALSKRATTASATLAVVRGGGVSV